MIIVPSNFAHVPTLDLHSAALKTNNESCVCSENGFGFSARLSLYALLVCAFLSTTSTPQSDVKIKLQVSSAPAIRNLWPHSPILESTAVK